MSTTAARARSAVDRYTTMEDDVAVPVPLGDLRALVADTEMLDWLAMVTNSAGIKVFIQGVGWIYLTREEIRAAMHEHREM